MAQLFSYDLKGQKLSFANWISMIDPQDTPFVSATGKESINETKHTWQTDRLAGATANNAVAEGSEAGDFTAIPTKEIDNQTQILRKVVIVSDTGDSVDSYGRGREVGYQLAKAGAEIKRDLEMVFLTNGAQKTTAGTAGNGETRFLGGVQGLVGYSAGNTVNAKGATHTGTVADPATGAVVQKTSAASGVWTEDELFDLTAQLYIAGAKADTIMINPKHAGVFSKMMEKDGTNGVTRSRYFENQNEIDLFVGSVVDPLGQRFKVVFNRLMPADKIFIFSPSDWTQLVLRAPKKTELAKTGSSSKYMIEMEVSLRHRNPYASAILTVKA